VYIMLRNSGYNWIQFSAINHAVRHITTVMCHEYLSLFRYFMILTVMHVHCVQPLKSLYQYDAVLSKIPTAEHYLSMLLGSIEIAHQRHDPVIMAQDYLQQLRKLTASVAAEKVRRDSDVSLVHTNVDGVQLVVEW